MFQKVGNKGTLLDIIYQDFAIDTCNDCCYKPDCDKLRKNNNDIDIWIRNKAIQKSKESKRLTNKQKEIINSLKK